jgi:CubicO group peptidase (beta-lactamase class C family)
MSSVLAALVTLAPCLAAGEAPRDLATLLEPIRERHDLPGLAAAVVTREGLEALGACGVRERGKDAPLRAGDRMHLGSCTKSMTATLCAILVEEQKLAWTTTVGASFPELAPKMNEAWKTVTLEQLLTNRGGAPGDVPRALWGELFTSKEPPRKQRELLAAGILELAPSSPPGSRFEYSNAGFAIAGLMAERAMGRSYEDLMRERLFAPLGMSSAGFGPPGTQGALDQPLGHRESGKPVPPGPGSDNPPAIAPAGRVHAALEDWARFVRMHLCAGELPEGRLLSAETVRKLHTEAAEDKDRYAFGWGVAERKWGGRVLRHSGSNTMWFCTVWMAPEKGFAILIATNQGGDAAAKACDEAASALIADRTARERAPRVLR